jgi:hypothetical protein
VVKHAAKGAASKAGGLASKVVKTVAERARRGKHATEVEEEGEAGDSLYRTGDGGSTSSAAAGTSFIDSTLTDSVRTRLRALARAARVPLPVFAKLIECCSASVEHQPAE